MFDPISFIFKTVDIIFDLKKVGSDVPLIFLWNFWVPIRFNLAIFLLLGFNSELCSLFYGVYAYNMQNGGFFISLEAHSHLASSPFAIFQQYKSICMA